MHSVRTRKKKSRLNKLKLHLVFWLFLCIVFSTIIYIQISSQIQLSKEIDLLKQQLDEAVALEQQLLNDIEFSRSDEFVIRYAHSELGLVFSNEVIIFNDNFRR
jgi:cell division protein FtsB